MTEINFDMLSSIAKEEFNKIQGPMQNESRLLNEFLDSVRDILNIDPHVYHDPLEDFPHAPLTMEDKWIYKNTIQFNTRKELIDWADSILTNKKIAAVDGSQIYEDRMIRIPVGLVRVVGLCVKYDGLTRPLILDEYHGINSEMKLPGGTPIEQNTLRLPNEFVDAFRAYYEHNLEIKLMEEKPDLIISDNPLIQSYLLVGKDKEIKKELISYMMRMLYYSKIKKIPVIGITDSPQSKEFCELVKAIHDTDKNKWEVSILDKKGIDDTHLIKDLLDLYDRTCVFCSQNEILDHYKQKVDINLDPKQDANYLDLDFQKELGFYYTRLSPLSIVRVELPLWIMKIPGLIDTIHQYICAQAAIGEGHPHLNMEAHHLVIIKSKYAQFFENVLLEEAAKTNIIFAGSTKELRKRIF